MPSSPTRRLHRLRRPRPHRRVAAAAAATATPTAATADLTQRGRTLAGAGTSSRGPTRVMTRRRLRPCAAAQALVPAFSRACRVVGATFRRPLFPTHLALCCRGVPRNCPFGGDFASFGCDFAPNLPISKAAPCSGACHRPRPAAFTASVVPVLIVE
jgi:hypothetical protein